jgi:hypothetical protein
MKEDFSNILSRHLLFFWIVLNLPSTWSRFEHLENRIEFRPDHEGTAINNLSRTSMGNFLFRPDHEGDG